MNSRGSTSMRQNSLSYLTDLERQTAPGRLATECSVAMNALTAAD